MQKAWHNPNEWVATSFFQFSCESGGWKEKDPGFRVYRHVHVDSHLSVCRRTQCGYERKVHGKFLEAACSRLATYTP